MSDEIFKHLDVFFSIRNIFDARYIADGFGQTLGVPRQVYGGLRAKF
jgi:outer membrane receptor protein involved in Fe transport